MKSFQTIYTEIQNVTGDSSTALLTRIKSWVNDTNQSILFRQWPFLETTKTLTTVASQQGYYIPNTLAKVASVFITIGSVIYRPKPVENLKAWEYLNALRIAVSSNITQFYYRRGEQILLWPIPQSAGNTITITGREKVQDLSLDDYTTGTIVTATNGDETITGSGTSWATGSIGNHMRIAYTAGDYSWYKISSVTDTTHLELIKPYAGTGIVAGSATYTIGEFSQIPGEYQNLLIYRPLAIYYASLENLEMANMYWRMYDGGFEAGLSSNIGGLLNKMIQERGENFEGVYMDEMQPVDPSTQDLIIKNFGYSGESW